VQFAALDKPVVLDRAQDAPAGISQRAARIRALFVEAGCSRSQLHDQPTSDGSTPNIICELPGESDATVIVGAHYDRNSSQRPSDTGGGPARMRALSQSRRDPKRTHTFIFVAFADQGSELAGAQSYAGRMSPSELRRTEAMVNLDALGLSPTKVWTSHSDKDL